MKFTLRVLFLGLLAMFALVACSSGAERGASDAVLEDNTTETNTRPVEAVDGDNRRPQFLNSYADW